MARHGFEALLEPGHAKDNRAEPRRFLIGAGNLSWNTPVFADMSRDEVATISPPLAELAGMVGEALGDLRKPKNKTAGIYVIADIYGLESKIGKALDPVARLATLQTGNPRRLFLHRVFWMPLESLDEIERTSHVAAASLFGRLEGEWFRCSPSEAHDVVEGAIKKCRHISDYCVMTPLRPLWKAS